MRWIDLQWEDDLNTLPLGDYAVVDLSMSRALPGGWEIYGGIENAFDRTFEVGRTSDGLVTIGMPLLVHGGVRVTF